MLTFWRCCPYLEVIVVGTGDLHSRRVVSLQEQLVEL